MTTKTIAIDARLVGAGRGGDSTYWTGLLYGLARQSPHLPLLLYSNAPKPLTIPETEMAWPESWDWRVITAKSNRLWSLVTFPLAARKAGAAVVHSQYNMSPLVGRRGATTIHDVSFLIEPSWFSRKDRFLLSRFVPSAIRRAARVIAVSNTDKAEIERFVPAAKGKTRTTLLAAAPWITPIDQQAAKGIVERQFGLVGPYLLTIGTTWARKNQQLALDAAAMLPSRLPHRLVVVGRGSEIHSGKPRTTGLGYVADEYLPALYAAADLLVFPSLHEGFGLPVLEAMALGCPVLCGQGGALPEVAGAAAHLMSNYEASDWATAISNLLTESSNLLTLREAGLKRAGEFDWDQTASATAEIYKEIAAS